LSFLWSGSRLHYSLKEHQRWIPSCSFAKGLCVGNNPIHSNGQTEKSSQQPKRSRYECGTHFYLRPNYLPERSKYYYLYFLFCYVCVFYNSALIFIVFTSTSPRTFKHLIRQSNWNLWDGSLYAEFGRMNTQKHAFSTWPALSKRNSDNLSKGAFS